MNIKSNIKEIVSEYDPRLKRMVLSSKRVCGIVSHFVCLGVLVYATIKYGVTDAIKLLLDTEIIGTLALLGITQFGKFIQGEKKDESAE